MSKQILIIQGHPDSAKVHLCHALEHAYAEGAREAGHEVHLISIADLDFPLLRRAEEFAGPPPESIKPSIEAMQRADHLVIIYPLWLGTMPALLKAYLEQLFRPGVALNESTENKWPKGLLRGKSCHIIVTMGMPALAYRWIFLSHSLKSLERNILKLSGIRPIRETILGMVDSATDSTRQKWFNALRLSGRQSK